MSRPIRFQTKLFLGFLLTALITLGTGVVSYFCFRTMTAHLGHVTHVDMPASLSLMNADMMHDALSVAVQRSLLLAETPGASGHEQLQKDVAESADHFNKSLAALDPLPLTAQARNALSELRPDLDRYVTSAREITSLAAHDRAAALARMPQFDEAYERLEHGLGTLNDRVQARINASLADSDAIVEDGERTADRILIAVILATLISLALGFGFGRSLMGTLRPLVDAVVRNANETASAVTQLSAASRTLAAGTSENAASLRCTSQALDQIASMTRRNSTSVQSAKESAMQTRSGADQGSSDIREMSQAMVEISKSSRDIRRIIMVIDEIAFQTNILALNAAVEAARAGDAGMGFAVVADEVRALAQRSAAAARETAASIEDAVRKSEHGLSLSTKVERSFATILSKSRDVDELACEIAAANDEQTGAIEQIHRSVTTMDDVTRKTATHAEESARTAELLARQVEGARSAVSSILYLVGTDAKAAPTRSMPVHSSTFRPPHEDAVHSSTASFLSKYPRHNPAPVGVGEG